ncbi:MaoC family dehydratase [Microbacterium album]|uniref:MaoC family dehydratase n=1 Tax=Microbacterium album TaxID=2053191 RepID=A0A917MP26_9MICO|nr:MaoC family dehydratase [Microbacterium album]GGH44832.1 MaoC family dehydratase [Microbacterium album]
MTTTVTYDELLGLTGRDLGWTEWAEIAQERVNTFADAVDDHQWIHVDPERAKDGPFGQAIAHGFLTLSLATRFWSELLEPEGVTTRVNYGLEKVRFVSPVPVGARVRMNAVVAEVTEVKGDGVQLAVDQTFEVEGSERPAVVARSLYRFYR